MNQEKKKKNKIKTFFGVILVGSGLWDFILKDLYIDFANFFIKTMSLFYNDYVNSLYKNVGKGGESILYLPSFLIIISIIFLPFITISILKRIFDIRDRKSTEIEDEKIVDETNFDKVMTFMTEKRIRLYALMLIITIPVSILYLDLLIKETSKTTSYNSLERNLEIIRPYVNEREYLFLKSDLRQINSQEKLISLYKKINKIEANNKLELPETKLLGIGSTKQIK